LRPSFSRGTAALMLRPARPEINRVGVATVDDAPRTKARPAPLPFERQRRGFHGRFPGFFPPENAPSWAGELRFARARALGKFGAFGACGWPWDARAFTIQPAERDATRALRSAGPLRLAASSVPRSGLISPDDAAERCAPVSSSCWKRSSNGSHGSSVRVCWSRNRFARDLGPGRHRGRIPPRRQDAVDLDRPLLPQLPGLEDPRSSGVLSG